MFILGIDIGGKTRNGFALIDSENGNLIKYSDIPYDKKGTPLLHRQKIVQEINEYLSEYKVDNIVFERINLFRGGFNSRLSSIVSLCKVQTSIIDNFSDKVIISETDVRHWKSLVFGNGNAEKEDALKYVKTFYPEVNLKIDRKPTKKDPSTYIENHDLADAVCIATYGVKNINELNDADHKVNYK